MSNYDDWICFTCGQPGHLKSSCPQSARHPAVKAAGEPPPYKRLDTIECPICERDWVAKFTDPAQILSTTICKWCRVFYIGEVSDDWPRGQPMRRQEAS